MSPPREWVTLLVLAPDSVDLDAWPAPSMHGAQVQYRDVIAGPPTEHPDDPSQPDGLGPGYQPDYWIDGVHSPPPGLARAVAAQYGARPSRTGARIYGGQLSGLWLPQAPAILAGVQLAGGPLGGLWGPPHVSVLLRDEDPALTTALETHLPGVPVRYVGGVTPKVVVDAIDDGLAELAASIELQAQWAKLAASMEAQ